MRHHAARDAGIERGHTHGKHLGAEGIDAAHLRGQIILAHGEHTAPVLGVHQQRRGSKEDDDDHKRACKGGVQRDARNALRAVEQEVLATDVDGELQIVEDQSDRLAHAKGRNAEIVALEVECDLAEARAEQHGSKAGENEREPVRQAEGHCADDGHIRADAHKARMAEGEHTGVAREDGKAQHDQQGVAGLNEDTFDVIPAKHIVPPSLCFVFHDLAHQAGGLDDEDEDQQRVHEQIAQVGVEGRDEDLHDAEQHRADDRAGETAETAEHCRNEGLVRDLTDGGLDDEAHTVEHTGKAREHAAHEEDDEDHEVAVDAHKRRCLLAVGAGADGKADLGLLYDEHQNQQRNGRNHDHQQTVHAEGDPADADAVVEDQGIVSGSSVDGGDDEVFKENGRAHRRDDEVERRGAALTQRRIDKALDDDREQAAAQAAQQERREKRDVQRRKSKIAHISADHDDASVGKVGKVHNAVDQRIADRHQRIHTAETDAVYQLLEKILKSHV